MKIVDAPPSIGQMRPIKNGILNVALDDDEEVIWIWKHEQYGSYVNGYKIHKKKKEER